jgi:signal transduction histidine kinase
MDALTSLDGTATLRSVPLMTDATQAALEAQNAELTQVVATLENELRRRDDFLAIVAHELRNPVTPVSLGVEVLLRAAEAGNIPDAETLLKRLRMFERQITQLTSDLTRLLDFSRVRAGRLDVELEADVELTQIVTDVLADMQPQLLASRCEVTVSLAAPQLGRWDRTRIRQIAWNLLSNAAKYAAGTRIEVTVRGDGYATELIVSDHGPGIPLAEQDKIFRRFERLTSEQTHTGFGVGLWLVKQIVDAFKGTITLHSTLGAGASFVVTLPKGRA